MELAHNITFYAALGIFFVLIPTVLTFYLMCRFITMLMEKAYRDLKLIYGLKVIEFYLEKMAEGGKEALERHVVDYIEKQKRAMGIMDKIRRENSNA